MLDAELGYTPVVGDDAAVTVALPLEKNWALLVAEGTSILIKYII